MYLLILNPAQFVAKMKMPLHSTMYLLISIADFAEEFLEHTLHSTMYLLILQEKYNLKFKGIFTFHYVSINILRLRQD